MPGQHEVDSSPTDIPDNRHDIGTMLFNATLASVHLLNTLVLPPALGTDVIKEIVQQNGPNPALVSNWNAKEQQAAMLEPFANGYVGDDRQECNCFAPPLKFTSSSGISASRRLENGTISQSTEWQNDSMNGPVVRGFTEFHPENSRGSSGCASVRFIQIARVRQNGVDYRWPLMESARNEMRTKCGISVAAGFYLDHSAAVCDGKSQCSPYFADYWPNSDEARSGYVNFTGTKSARLVDYPYGWEIIDEMLMENCAVCEETGRVLGCVTWGARWDQAGQSLVVPYFSNDPSPTFVEAIRNFDAFYQERGLLAGKSIP